MALFTRVFLVPLLFGLASPAQTMAAVSQPDYSQLSAQIISLTQFLGITGTVTIPTFSVQNPLAALPLPASNIAQALLTGVPKSVLVDLGNPSARASLASEFQAGDEPAWYTSLPVEVRSYISQIHAKAPGYTEDESTQTGPKVTLRSQGPQKTNSSTGTAATATESNKSSSCVMHVLWFTIVGFLFVSILVPL